MNYETMPFGKYKGVLISELPANYKVYALTEFDLPNELKYVIFNSLFKDLGISNNDVFRLSFSAVIYGVYEDLIEKYKMDENAIKIINEFKEAIL